MSPCEGGLFFTPFKDQEIKRVWPGAKYRSTLAQLNDVREDGVFYTYVNGGIALRINGRCPFKDSDSQKCEACPTKY